jgi:hypothetical protein
MQLWDYLQQVLSAATYSEVTTGINPAYAALGLLTTGIIKSGIMNSLAN